MSRVRFTRPDGTSFYEESNDSSVIHAVDADGNYLGLVPPDTPGAQQVRKPPPTQGTWIWNAMGGWTRVRVLADVVIVAHRQIDAAAGATRLKYITDVPGQQATYLTKESQARAYLAAPTGPVPPYVQAEADVMSSTAQEAAEYIVETATLWSEVVGPTIEKERRRGKVAVSAATTIEQVDAELATSLSALAQL